MAKLKFINRRDFIQQSGMLVTAALVTLPNFSKARVSKYKMGLQLFTIRDAMDKDPIGSLGEVASIGYEDLETYGKQI